MPEKDNPGMGERIQSMVEDAINSMDFEQLNKNITGSIQSVFEELNIQPPAGTRSKVSSTSNVRYHYGTEKKTGERGMTRYVKNPPGTVTGPLCTALGGVFTGIFGITSIVMAAVQSAGPCCCYGRTYYFVPYNSVYSCFSTGIGKGSFPQQTGEKI